MMIKKFQRCTNMLEQAKGENQYSFFTIVYGGY